MNINRTKLAIVRITPWWVLRGLWKTKLVERSTVFRWEMNVMVNEWDGPVDGEVKE